MRMNVFFCHVSENMPGHVFLPVRRMSMNLKKITRAQITEIISKLFLLSKSMTILVKSVYIYI